MSRYKGQLIAWDVVNENMHFSFFESKLGENISAKIYNEAHRVDGNVTLFLNEYNTIEYSGDGSANPTKYLQKLREIQNYPGNSGLPLGIGLESHFTTPNLPYVRASIDTLAATGFPIWLTELDVSCQPLQTQYLEQILREAHSHPKVEGIMMWTGRDPNKGCWRMCLTDSNFKNLPTGDVVDKLLQEWGLRRIEGTTDTNGSLKLPFSMVIMK
ncbi:putative Endo-1,4-beta-xylanase [Quillaja saponaria]|uniref:Endo-1,4-beta-xylanase n=1 Tax=Quillaja saponaria TaxID=32244 RepID=A0AAD7LKB8_QUISA|nr:putative Endo-1,4-beta-xylanase [Quillaja saponaria]